MAACVAVVAPTAQDGGAVDPTSALLARAATYVDRFEASFSNIVAEERYSQTVIPQGHTYVGGPLARHRELVSDFLLVRTTESGEWLPFRDVFQVDGRPIRDHQQRLTDLFVKPTADSAERAADITEESARYNIGVIRTVNNPLLVLHVLRRSQQGRFQFAGPKPESHIAGVVWTEFVERERPTVIHGPSGTDMPMRGRVWINDASGALVKAEVMVESPGVSATLTTLFDRREGFAVAIPVEMTEDYRQPDGSRVTGTAVYGRFRRFQVDVKSTFDRDQR